MALTTPIHSARLGTLRHHNNDECRERNNIETWNVRYGTGGLPLCEHCQRFNNALRYRG